MDETLEPGSLPDAVARLALRKARAVATGLSDGVVLGADTVVVADGTPLGKPTDPADAVAMLRRLRGRWHEVITAIAAVDAATGRHASQAVMSRVLMSSYTDADIDAYVATGEPLDKAGAYAIQGRGGELVAGFRGSYTNIVGLPIEETRALLEAFGALTSTTC